MRKIGGLYYFVYTDISRGNASCLSYAVSRNPLGPFEKGGVIIDNDGCDPRNWNNHGSIQKFKGQWYVFYHRASQNSKFNRRVCVEKIMINRDGSIDEVPMTTQGPDGPLNPYLPMEGGRACLLGGEAFITPCHGSEKVCFMCDGDTAFYRYYSFDGSTAGFEVTAASGAYGGTLLIFASKKEIGRCEIGATGSFDTFETFVCPVAPVDGIHELILQMRGGDCRLADVLSFRFNHG